MVRNPTFALRSEAGNTREISAACLIDPKVSDRYGAMKADWRVLSKLTHSQFNGMFSAVPGGYRRQLIDSYHDVLDRVLDGALEPVPAVVPEAWRGRDGW